MLIEFKSIEQLNNMSADELYQYIVQMENTPVPEYEFQAGETFPQFDYSRNTVDIGLIERLTLKVLKIKKEYEEMAAVFGSPVKEIAGYKAEAWLADFKYLYDRATTINKLKQLVSVKPQLLKMISSNLATELALKEVVSKM